MGNVLMVNTTLAAGTDNQAFCYDEQNRLTWAGACSTAQLACGGQYTPGTLSAAYYSTGHTYDVLDRLTSATSMDGDRLHGVKDGQIRSNADTSLRR